MAQKIGSFQAALFSFANLPRNKGFYLAESPFFCLSQQKKRTARKELPKRAAFSAHVNRLNVMFIVHVFFFDKGFRNTPSFEKNIFF